jgi:hypothetical protein
MTSKQSRLVGLVRLTVKYPITDGREQLVVE